jgi:iron uptake system component EfeO
VYKLLRCVAPGGARKPGLGFLLLANLALVTPACDSSDTPKTDAQLQSDIVSNMHQLVMDEINRLIRAARDLQAAAPATVAEGWDSSPAAETAMAAMQKAWRDSRLAWESIEGTVSPLFPDVDESLDARYEDLLATGTDATPFDGQGATGMHAIERVMFAPSPDAVATYESTLTGYWLAARPSTDQDAAQFKNGLAQRFVDDSTWLGAQWSSRTIDLDVVFMGLTGLIASQAEKLSLAAVHQEESRYSRTTMADMRANLKGTRDVYELFVPWLDSKPFGMTTNKNAVAALQELDRNYSLVEGDAVPEPPTSWTATGPQTTADLMTPFGALYSAVFQAADSKRVGSAVDAMNHVAWALGLATEPTN